jgi:cytochrome b involved in lipid metabolism
MGWLTLKRQAQSLDSAPAPATDNIQNSKLPYLNGTSSSDTESTVQHIENISPAPKRSRPCVYPDVPDNKLPFIPTTEITAKRCDPDSVSDLWIVIDKIVYDCSVFVYEHPGGDAVIKNFKGSDCSWQFWRFHGKEELKEHGKGLRIGRTAEMSNLYKERPKYVGLKALCSSMDEW